jgi:alkylhydroperoxidase/carboxymuconolactone decarboxylase family protein YurZ
MTTSRPINWKDNLAKGAPELSRQVSSLEEMAMKDGALSVKTKTLMMMLCDAMGGRHEGVASLAKRARALGATEAEIQETVAVAFMMGGLLSVVPGATAFRE